MKQLEENTKTFKYVIVWKIDGQIQFYTTGYPDKKSVTERLESNGYSTDVTPVCIIIDGEFSTANFKVERQVKYYIKED